MSYRVLIPTAGTGSRLGNLTRYLNKSLVGIANRPTICHIIDRFPTDTEFVVALGHKGTLVKEFLTLAYPRRRFFFVEVAPFEGPGSGLGLSILACREYLRQPFAFISCDTVVREPVPALEYNWMAYTEPSGCLHQYRTLEVAGEVVTAVCEKGTGSSSAKPYIGLAGIRDHKTFWSAMEMGGEDAILIGESFGMRSLLARGVHALPFTWYDTGNLRSLEETRLAFHEPDQPNILEKANEAIWFLGEEVIKFSDDTQFIANRVARTEYLKGYVPEVTGATPHMYRYRKAEGREMSKAVTLPLFHDLLCYAGSFWRTEALSSAESAGFRAACLRFYRDKTYERVDLFFKNFELKDTPGTINGVAVPSIATLLDGVDWEWLTDGLPGRFHGDFHFENILYSQSRRQFVFLDWRQDFGGSLTIGDIYYDLAKLMHGLIICHELIAQDLFSVTWDEERISYDFLRKQILVECERLFMAWLQPNGYDHRKVSVLTALVFLNIAALHHYPYSLLLFALGKKMLHDLSGSSHEGH
jgi:hypothetical protein